MAKILIAYATVEGQTRKIAEHVADCLSGRGNEVRLVDLAAPPPDLDPAAYDAVFLAASVHMGRHNAAATHFVARHADALSRRPSVFISVSLHAASSDPEDEEEARAYVDAFCRETAWLPHAVCYAAGALRFTTYDFFKRFAARAIAKRCGLTPDEHGDMELTDWRAVEAFVGDFQRAHLPGS
jgi:menaquinone-dependent protoporphyrinogen oxidase